MVDGDSLGVFPNVSFSLTEFLSAAKQGGSLK